jgi:hypothetical protein
MMRLSRVLSTVTVVCGFILMTNQAYAGFQSCNDLIPMMYEYVKANEKQEGADYSDARVFRAYVQGVFDATESDYETPEELESRQMVAVVVKYIKDNPKKWSLPAASVIKEALRDAFPKSQ